MEELKGTTSEIRKLNKNRIFELIYEKGQVSRQDIAVELSLSLPTVNQNLKELFEDNLVTYAGNFESTGGRKPQIITIKEDARVAIGLSITRNSIRTVAVDLWGRVLFYKKAPYSFSNREEYGKKLKALADDYVDKYKISKSSILGVGIAVPGVFQADFHSVRMAPSLGREAFPTEMLIKHLNCPYVVDNDANAGMFAERWNQKDKTDVAYLLVEKGVGGAMYFHDQIYKGANGRAGEFGHMTIAADGMPCRCGRQGCLEAYISTARITDDLNCQLEEFFQGLDDGNIEYERIWEDYLHYLCLGISNLRINFDCDVMLGGLITQYMDKYEERIRRTLTDMSPFENSADYFKLAKYRSSAPAAGVALQLVKTFIESV